MRAIGYVRVSTKEQANDGLSPEVQQAHIQQYAKLKNIDLIEIQADLGVSGGKPLRLRRGGLVLLNAVRAKEADAVVAVKLDRLFRDVSDCLTVIREWDVANVGLHLVNQGGASIDTRSAMGRFFLTVMAGVAEMERNVIAERTQDVIDAKKNAGERTGQIPFGYKLARDGMALEHCAEEQAALTLIAKLRYDGLSYAEVADTLNRRRIETRKGEWTKAKVLRLTQRQSSGWRPELR